MGLFDNLSGTTTAPAAPSTEQQVTGTVPAAEAVIETPPVNQEPPAQQQTPNTPPPADAKPVDAPPAATPDYNTFLDKMSEGLIKDEDSFKAALPQIKEYGTLKKERDELAAKMAQAPVFADDEVRILNELKRSGASKEQIKTFQKINEYGSVSEMSDKDALIAKMVMDGTKESTAEIKVERMFKLNEEDMDPTEREVLDDDMRVAAKEAKAGLEQLKAKASEVPVAVPEETELQKQAKIQAHESAVKPYVRDVMSALPHLGVFSLAPAKDGAKEVSYTMPIDDNIKAELGNYVQNYFMDGLVPVTPETTMEAMAYARAEYFRTNAEKVFQDVFHQGYSKATEVLTNKYENRSGLKPQKDNPVLQGTNDAAATANFAAKVANRQLS